MDYMLTILNQKGVIIRKNNIETDSFVLPDSDINYFFIHINPSLIAGTSNYNYKSCVYSIATTYLLQVISFFSEMAKENLLSHSLNSCNF